MKLSTLSRSAIRDFLVRNHKLFQKAYAVNSKLHGHLERAGNNAADKAELNNGIYRILPEYLVKNGVDVWDARTADLYSRVDAAESFFRQIASDNQGRLHETSIPWSTPAGSGYDGEILLFKDQGWQTHVTKRLFFTVGEYISTWYSPHRVTHILIRMKGFPYPLPIYPRMAA